MRHFFLFFSLSVLFVTGLSAQNIIVEGVISDEDTGEPIPFAAVATRFNQGGFANESGQYHIEFPASLGIDSIYSSHLSYTPKAYSVTGLEPGRVNEINIELKSSIVALDMVKVTSRMDPIYLIKKTLRNVSKTYGAEKFILKGYYREYSIEDNEYSEFTEALITVKDSDYTAPKFHSSIYLDRINLSTYKGEVNETMRHGDENPLYTLYEGFSNGARRHTLHWMTSGKVDFFEDFEFNRLAIYTNGRDTIVRVGYEMVPERTGFSKRTLQLFSGWTKGEILINVNDLAFIQITRGNEKGSSYSESTYHKIRGKYYPRTIQKTTGFSYGRDKYYLNNQTLVFTDLFTSNGFINKKDFGTRVVPNRQFSELRIKAKNRGKVESSMVYLPLSKALEVEKAKRLLQESLGKGSK